jgi:polysaccharide export outer membrane protein
MKNIVTVIIFSSLALLYSGCSSSSEEIAKDNLTQIIRSGSRPIQAETQSDNYVIRQGDQIQFSVWNYPEFNTTGYVKETGTVTVPLIGDLPAAGATKEQFSDQLRQKLAEYIQGEIKLTISITSTIVQKVAVLGAVTKQDSYPLTADVSLLEILSTAGGTTTDSDLRHVRILRSGLGHQPIEIDLTSYIENGNIESIPMVRPGDTVFVPKKANIIREMSDFMRDAIFIFGFFRVFN